MINKAPITGATNQRYIDFVSVADGKCQNWRYLDFISQMKVLYSGSEYNPISSQSEFSEFIKNNKHKYKVHIYEID